MTVLERVGHLGDVPMGLDVELDRIALTAGALLRLEPGHLLRLGRSAGENVDILVAGTLVGFGELVVMEDTMGVRITDFRTPE